MPAFKIAFDESLRTYDVEGRLHISRTHISKACVNPYYGREIPTSEALGLIPDKIYYLLRAPEELEKAAASFARLPILSKHIPVTADSLPNEFIIGSIGSDVDFSNPYLDADICIWEAQAIGGIETNAVRELSCAYRYVPIMVPGEYQGTKYDGIMTEIIGNHLAVVESGRAGPDVLAADSSLIERALTTMKMTKLGKALFVAVTTASPKLAADASISPLFAGITKKNLNKADLTAKLIAVDSELTAQRLGMVFDAMSDMEPDSPPAQDAEEKEENENDEPKRAKDESEEDFEDRKKKAADKKAKDSKMGKDAKHAKDCKGGACDCESKAMDAAIDAKVSVIKSDLRAADEARRLVRSVVGDVIAQDSAASIYEFALDQMKVDHAEVKEVPALKALFTLASSKTAAAAPIKIAQDAAGLATRFPNATRFRLA